MKPTIIEQLTIDTVLAASSASANTHASEEIRLEAAVNGRGERALQTIHSGETNTRGLPAADVTALLNLLTEIITSWQREAPPSSPPEAQALRQVTIRQAAAILGVHERTIRRLVRRGELHAVGRGRLTRIALRDIAEYQKRNRR
jgi:excisionase family DNA binding protein